ncbi:MAG TPA: aminotransferase class IV [Gemmatimonadaceae bacterium]
MRAAARAASSELLWVNGDRVDPGASHVSALDRGFTMADGLFETMRAYRGTIFRATQHLERLASGARVLGIRLPDDLEHRLDSAMRSAHAVGLDEARVRLTVSRGVAAPGLALDDNATPTVVVAVQPVPAFPAALYDAGISALTATARRNERGATSGIKTLSYTEAIVALAQARAAGADDAILLDTEGHLSEAAASNVFLYARGVLVTPPLSCGALPGITRAAVLEIAPALGLEVRERPVGAQELALAEEAFLTSSLREIAPLVRVDHRAIGSGTVGVMTRRVMDAFAALVERECAP